MMFSFVCLISQTILFLRFLMIKDAVSLVEKERTPIRELEPPLGSRAGAREGASFVAEEFALKQETGNCGAVKGNERPLPSRTLVVNGAGDDFFARTGLALNQCHAIAIRDHTDQVQNLLKHEASSHNLDGARGVRFAIHRNPLSLCATCRFLLR